MSGQEGGAIALERIGVDVQIEDEEDVYITMRRVRKIEGISKDKCTRLAIIACVLDSMDGIEGCTSLECLDLSQNQITKVAHLQGMTRLRELDLSFNKINEIECLEDCKGLEQLRLQNNRLSHIHPMIRTLTNLRELEVGSNKITQIENIPTENLEELWLGRNRISVMQLPADVASFPKLRIISLQNNLLTKFDPAFFSKFPSLKELYLSENFIDDQVPQDILQLKDHLEILDLSSNKLTSLGPIAEMTNLKELWLNNNQIESFDEIKRLRKLQNLETIYLDGNPFKANLGPGYRSFVLELLPSK